MMAQKQAVMLDVAILLVDILQSVGTWSGMQNDS